MRARCGRMSGPGGWNERRLGGSWCGRGCARRRGCTGCCATCHLGWGCRAACGCGGRGWRRRCCWRWRRRHTGRADCHRHDHRGWQVGDCLRLLVGYVVDRRRWGVLHVGSSCRIGLSGCGLHRIGLSGCGLHLVEWRGLLDSGYGQRRRRRRRRDWLRRGCQRRCWRRRGWGGGCHRRRDRWIAHNRKDHRQYRRPLSQYGPRRGRHDPRERRWRCLSGRRTRRDEDAGANRDDRDEPAHGRREHRRAAQREPRCDLWRA
jgi:hypothetical protein